MEAWNLLIFALAGIVIAVFLNRRNSRLGYRLNLSVVSMADLGFLIFVFFPGIAPVVPLIFGPVLGITAAAHATIAVGRTK